MGSLDAASVRNLLKEYVAETVVDDTPIAFKMNYTGTGSVTSVTVDTNQDITLVTSDGGTEEFLLSTYTTMGTLVDAINASTYWECKLLDALRADSTASSPFVDDASVTANADGTYDALIDTSAFKSVTYRVCYDRAPFGDRPKGSHRVHLQEVVYNINVNGASANGFQIHKWDPDAKTETQIYRKASVDATETTVNFASGRGLISGGFSRNGNGCELIVRVTDATSITDAAGNFLECVFIRE